MLKHHSVPLPPAEQRQVLAADERKREFHEEKRNEFESFAEEEHDGTESRDISDTLGENHPLTHCSSNSGLLHRTRRAQQREHRAVEGVSLRRHVSSPGVRPSLHLRRRRTMTLWTVERSATHLHFITCMLYTDKPSLLLNHLLIKTLVLSFKIIKHRY